MVHIDGICPKTSVQLLVIDYFLLIAWLLCLLHNKHQTKLNLTGGFIFFHFVLKHLLNYKLPLAEASSRLQAIEKQRVQSYTLPFFFAIKQWSNLISSAFFHFTTAQQRAHCSVRNRSPPCTVDDRFGPLSGRLRGINFHHLKAH